MKRHSFDPLSLVFGMLFAAIGGLYLAGNFEVADLVARFWPAALVLLGLAMLFSTRRTEPVPAAPPPPAWTAPPPAAPVSPTPTPAPPVAAAPTDDLSVSPSDKPLEPRTEPTIQEKPE